MMDRRLLTALSSALIAALLACAPSAAPPPAPEAGEPGPFELVAWNINAGVGEEPSADFSAIAQALDRYREAELFALSEVHPRWAMDLDRAARASGQRLLMGEDGRRQRLALIVDEARFEVLEWEELYAVDKDGRGRAPLSALLRDRVTGSTLLVVVVHLRRGDAAARTGEAASLAAMLAQTDHPTLLVGDFNFDCDAERFPPEGCNQGWHALAEHPQLRWRPHTGLAPTHCSRGRYHSVLDYVFTVNGAADWGAEVTLDGSVCQDAMGRGAHAALHAVIDPRVGDAAPTR